MDQAVIDQATTELTLAQRRTFLTRPMDERRRVMREQAAAVAEFYELPDETHERLQWQGGDVVEYIQH